MHPSDGTLRRLLDEPVAIDAATRQHLAACSRCAGRLQRIGADAARAAALLAVPAPVADVEAARARLARTEGSAPPSTPGGRRGRAPAPARRSAVRAQRIMVGVALAATASIVVVVTGASQDFLSLFQPKQLAPVPVTFADVRSLSGLTSYGNVHADGSLHLQPEANAAAAAHAAGIAVPVVGDVPSGATAAPSYAVVSGGVVSFTFDATLAKAAAARAGGVLPSMPRGLDGSTLTVSIAPAVVISYGFDAASLFQGGGLPSSNTAFVVVASRTPTVSTTGVTMRQLEDYLLSVPGIPAGVASELRALGNPEQTVPVPIPIDLASGSTVSINGAPGVLIGELDRARQRRRLDAQWRRGCGRGHAELRRGARGRALSALTPAVASEAAPGADEPAVRTVELTKHYGAAIALSGLTMVVPRGEVFGFLGPNGSGKTTAVKLLLGLTRPTGGGAWVLGRRAGDRETRSRVGYLPELFRYQGWLSAREVLALHCRLAGIPRTEWSSQISDALSTVGLSGHGDAKVETFSKGMQQRLGLGVALLGNPELVVLDEPTSALDPVGRADTRTIIRRLRERGSAVFLNSHLLGEVEQVCDRVAVVSGGRVLATGRLDELLGTGGVRLRLTGVDGAAHAAMARRGTVTELDGWVTVAGLAADAVPDLVTELVAGGARVYAVEPLHQTLEERFLSLLQAEEARWQH